jgi:hypothetical protein
VPKYDTHAIPRGAAVLAAGRDAILVFHDGREPFGERCAKAAKSRFSPIGDRREYIDVGSFETIDGELRLQHHGVASLSRWLGHPVGRSDLVARDNRDDRRHRARQLFFQGRFAEAFRIYSRMGF